MEKQTFFQSCLKNLNSVVQTLHLLELDLCERACLSATFISHQSLVEKRASVFEKRASVLSLEALLTALAGQCEPRPFIYWDNHRCRHVLLLLLDLSTVWVCTILYVIAFLYSHLLTPFVLSSMYNCTQMTSGRLTHWQRAAKQRSSGDSASFLSRQAAPCMYW